MKVGYGDILAAIFIVLKLTGLVHWSWWWVLAPIWIPWSFVILLAAAAGMAAAYYELKK